MIARKILLSAFALLTLVFVGCKDDDPEFVALNVETKEIVEGEVYQFYVESYQGTISWSIDSEKVATIDQTGKVTGVSVGTTKVRALLSNGTNLMAVLTVNGRGLETDSISVALETIKMAPNAESKFGVEIVKKEYINSELYPLHVTIEPANNLEQATEEIPGPPTATSVLRADSTGYDVTIVAGKDKGDYVCKVALGEFEHEIFLTVDFGVYLSHNSITVEDLNSGIGTLTYKTISLGETLTYSFFCYLDGASDAQKEAVRQSLKNKDNYIVENLTVEIGDVTIDESGEVWTVSLPVKSTAKVYELGTISLTVEDKTLVLSLTCDDGRTFQELYISFEDIYTYTEQTKCETRKLDASYLKYVGGVEGPLEKERFKIVVWYTMSPDDRGDFISWNLSLPQGSNAPVKFIGQEKINTKQFEFEFEVNAPGEANIGFSIVNPKADDPLLSEKDKEYYEKYRNQTISAFVSVVDRNTVDVESVVFVESADPSAEPITTLETSASSVPLYTYILPEESAGAWPSVFTVEPSEGAEATVKQSGIDENTGDEILPEVTITHAGTVNVQALSKDKTSNLIITAKNKIDQTAQGEKLQLTTSKNEYTLGETDKISTLLRSSYKVYANEYSWVSDNEAAVTVDAEGNIATVADGKATITVSYTDDYGYTATATKEISVRSVSADANLNDAQWADYYVIDLGEEGIYYIDTEEGSDELFTMNLSANIAAEGTYTAGTDFTGTIQFPSNDTFEIVGGTITVSGDQWTFDLNISGNGTTGKVTGTKGYMFFEE